MGSDKPQHTLIWQVTLAAPGGSKQPRLDLMILDAYTNGQGQFLTEQPELKDLTPTLTRSKLKQLFDQARVTSGNIPLKSTSKLTQPQVIELAFEIPQRAPPVDIPLIKVFEDTQILVINKQAGLTVHPSPTQMDNTLLHALHYLDIPLSPAAGKNREGIVHRLDKNTTGLLILAKTDQAYTGLIQQFLNKTIEKKYWAIVWEAPKDQTIQTPIGRHPVLRQKMHTVPSGGKPAMTLLRKLETFEHMSLIELTLLTGRTHQIRVHLTSIGHPIVGDPVYTTPKVKSLMAKLDSQLITEILNLPGQALHAKSLTFTHPTFGPKAHRLHLLSEPAMAFATLLQRLRKQRS